MKGHHSLNLPLALRRRLSAMVSEGYPQETCGLLVGLELPSGAEVLDLVQAPNLAVGQTDDRFRVDPRAFALTDGAARARGMEIVGIWHSHPDQPAVPSDNDLEQAWPGWSYLIASVGPRGLADLRSWRLAGEDFSEETVETCLE